MVPLVRATRPLDPGDGSYPKSLSNLRDRRLPGSTRWPVLPILYLRGALPQQPVVAVVGTRKPCAASLAWTERLVHVLGRAGFAIGSGGAAGIDEAAHRAALAHDVPTVVVTVGGLDGVQHRKDGDLHRAVLAAGGAVVSLDPDGTQCSRPDYFRRNHVLAAMATGIVAVELRAKVGQGGTGHTVRAGRALGRPVMTVAHPPWSSGGAAAVALSRMGVPFVASMSDVLEHLRVDGHPKAPQPSTGCQLELPSGDPSEQPPSELGLDAAKAYASLGPAPTHLDRVIVATGLAAAAAVRALLECNLAGLVHEGPPGCYARSGQAPRRTGL